MLADAAISPAAEPPAAPSLGSLPDHILMHIFSWLPVLEVLPCEGLFLSSRGAAERVCQRWRQLLLQAGKLTLLIKYSNWRPAEATAQEAHAILLALGSCRQPEEVVIRGSHPELLRAVAGRALQGARRLVLSGDASSDHLVAALQHHPPIEDLQCDLCYCDPNLDSIAPAIQALPSLTSLQLEGRFRGWHHPSNGEGRKLSADCMRGVLTGLQRISLGLWEDTLDEPWWPLLAELGCRLQSLEVTAACHNRQVLHQLQRLPDVGELRLRLSVEPQLAVEQDALPEAVHWLGLMSALRELRCHLVGQNVPAEVWALAHLSYLRLETATISEDGLDGAALGSQLTALRDLVLEECAFPASRFPAGLCARQLTSIRLEMCEGDDPIALQLPSEMSSLRLRKLVLDYTELDGASLTVLSPLTCLTHLGCRGSHLPDGAYLAGLQQLALSTHSPSRRPLLPSTLLGATSLRRLSVNNSLRCLQYWHQDNGMKGVLIRLPSLRAVHVVDCYDERVGQNLASVGLRLMSNQEWRMREEG